MLPWSAHYLISHIHVNAFSHFKQCDHMMDTAWSSHNNEHTLLKFIPHTWILYLLLALQALSFLPSFINKNGMHISYSDFTVKFILMIMQQLLLLLLLPPPPPLPRTNKGRTILVQLTNQM